MITDENHDGRLSVKLGHADLHTHWDFIARTRWTNELPGVGDEYGVPLAYVKKLAEYWQNGYNWRGWEARLNQYPQFTTATSKFLSPARA